MRRYLVFAGSSYYANGGWLDFQGDADTLDDALAMAKQARDPGAWGFDWWHVVDSETREITTYKSGSYCGAPSLVQDANE